MQASLLFILSIALVFECSIIQDDEDSIIYNWSEFIRGESMTVNSTEGGVVETSGGNEDEKTVSFPARQASGQCPPAVYLGLKKRVRTPLDGPFTHKKSESSEWPNRMIGKIFFTRPNGERSTCSGAVIQRRLVVTAGHCTFKNGKYMRDFVFIPAFDNGVAPYGVWSFHQAFVSPSWLSYSKVPNEGDWTIFVVKDKLSRGQQISIGDCLGWFGISTNNLVDNHVTSLGYADNFDFGARMHQVYSQYRRNRTNRIVEYPSDMTEGASGGPWVENFGSEGVYEGDEQNRLVGVTSFRDADSSRKYLASSILGSKFVEVFHAACKETVGNCVFSNQTEPPNT